MESAQESVSKKPDVLRLLVAAKAQLGSWEAVAEKLPGISDETLRKIGEGITKKPTRDTVTQIILAFGTPPLSPGVAAELREALRLARQAVAILERLDGRSTGIVEDPAITKKRSQAIRDVKRQISGQSSDDQSPIEAPKIRRRRGS